MLHIFSHICNTYLLHIYCMIKSLFHAVEDAEEIPALRRQACVPMWHCVRIMVSTRSWTRFYTSQWLEVCCMLLLAQDQHFSYSWSHFEVQLKVSSSSSEFCQENLLLPKAKLGCYTKLQKVQICTASWMHWCRLCRWLGWPTFFNRERVSHDFWTGQLA